MSVSEVIPQSVTLTAKPQDIDVDLSASALIVVDMQNAYASRGGYLDLAGFDISGIEAVVETVGTLIKAARAASLPVIFLQNGWDADYVEAGGAHSVNQRKSNALRVMRERPELRGKLLAKGGWDYALIDELVPGPDDIVLPKTRYSGFVGTALDSMLRSRGVRHLLFCGVATNVCVETTMRDAFGLEYHPVLVREACLQAGPAYLQEATFYNIETFFGWTAAADDVIAALNKA
ncbi:MAG: cysteine hydrolase family protein [Pseudomonadota bacterium]